MCDQCEKLESLFGVGSPLVEAARELIHPPAAEAIAERQRAIEDLVDYLNDVDGYE